MVLSLVLMGSYRIELVADDVTLSFSFIGFTTQEILVAGRNVIDITLLEDAISLDEVVAIGYGGMKKSDLTGSINEVKMDQQRASVNSMAEELQAKVPGITVVNQTGDPTAAPRIRIRGIGTLSNEEPLWVVDGTVTGAPANMSDIESMTILKDASAAAIYGARAAAGVYYRYH